MTRPSSVLLPFLLLGAIQSVEAEPPEGWDCRYCPDYEPDRDVIEAGAAHSVGDTLLATSSATPSRPSDAATAAWISAIHVERMGDAGVLDLEAERLGLANPRVAAHVLQSPPLEWDLNYAEWLSRPGARAKTVFTSDGATLALPTNWQRANQTAGMDLDSALTAHRDQRQRKRLTLGVGYDFARNWSTQVQLSHEEREGRGHLYGSFLTQSSFLPRLVEDATSSLSWTASYLADRFAAAVTYRLSQYSNEQRSLSWENPFSAISDGADTGELALAPDNLAQSLDFNGSFRASADLRFGAATTLYRSTQNEDLLPPSANPNFQPALPRTRSDAKIDGTRTLFFADYTANAQWRWRLSHRFWERNNRTPESLFAQIRTDSFASAERRSIAYDFRDQQWALDTHYRPARKLSLKLEMEQQTRTRTQQLRRETAEDRVRLKFRWHALPNVDLRLRGGWLDRDGSAFETSMTLGVIENSRQRAFNLADRRRHEGGIDVSWQQSLQLQIGITADWIDDDYPASPIGLRSSSQQGFQAQASGLIHDEWNWAVHVGQQTLRTQQAGAETGTNWLANGRDVSQSLTATLNKPKLVRQVDLNLSYQWTRTESDSRVAGDAFPALTSDLHSVDLQAIWHWRPKIDWVWLYRYERFHDEDSQRLGLAPDAIANVLGWNATPQNEVGHLIAISARYQF